jgi:glucan phosphoethanolaminetransferase (alkaline phosphatase superfamily)
MTTNQTAKTLGNIAFANGISCAPALDKSLTALLTDDHKQNMQVMRGWLAGWTQANMAAA